MSARAYNLNPESAKKAESSRITTTGKYIGKFTSAEAITSEKGTEGIELSFKSDAGGTADYLTLWTYNKEGKELYGSSVLNALMTCLALREIKPTDGTVEKWDGQAQARVQKKATVFPDLVNKPIGVLLQREEYVKNDNSIGEKMALYLPFCAKTQRTATEILAKADKAQALDKIAATLKDKTVAKVKPSAATPATAAAGAMEDDDLPF